MQEVKGLGNCGCGEDNVCSCQHAEEEVHGSMETRPCEDNEDEQAVPKQGSDIGNEEDQDPPQPPYLRLPKLRNATDIWLPGQSPKVPLHHWGIYLQPTGLPKFVQYTVSNEDKGSFLPKLLALPQ
ncbi:hypothetical protein STEG23_036707 [Scotinomys teguina]